MTGLTEGSAFVFGQELKLTTLTPAVAKEAEEIVIPTICHGCSYGGYNCGILAHTKRGVLAKVEGNPDHPLNKGRLCAKGQSAVQWVYSPQRLKYPLIRVGERGENRFKRISWDEALNIVADKLKEIKEKYGPECIILAKGQSSSWAGLHHLLWTRFLYSLGSANLSWWGPAVCYGPQLLDHRLTIGGPTYARADYDNADLIIEWFTGGGKGGAARGGEETLDTNLRSVPIKILDRLKKGARLVVINPQLIPLAANNRAYKWLSIRPGTDSALALAMINVIINEELYDKEFVSKWCYGFDKLKEHVQKYSPEWAEKVTDIPTKEIRSLAREYATTKRACIRISESPEKRDLQSFGMAIPMLIAITGHLDRPGGNVYFLPAARLGFDTFSERLSEDVKKKVLGADKFYIISRGRGVADFLSVIEALHTGKPYLPKALLIFGTNPLSTARNPALIVEGLKKIEFIMAVDVAPTPTVRYADIVLPAATRYECDGEPVLWQNHLTMTNKVIEPLWETRNELEVTLDLARRLGMEKDFWNGDYQAMLNDFLKPVKITTDQLRKNAVKGIYLPRTEWMDKRERYEKHFESLPDRKVQLYNTVLEKHGFEPLPTYKGEPEDPINTPELLKEYPLIFTDEHSSYLNHSSWMRNIPWLREIEKYPYVKINPITAKKYAIKDGDWVEIISPHGKMKAVAWLFAGIRPDTVMGQHGWWQGCDELGLAEYSPLDGGTNPNVLFNWEKRDGVTGNLSKNTLVKIRKTSPPNEIPPIKEVT